MTQETHEVAVTKSVSIETRSRSFANYGKIEDIETAQLSADEVTALRALKKFDFQWKEYNLYDTIRDYGGGTMVLIETFHKEGENTVTRDYQILVRNGCGTVYNDYAQALRLANASPSTFSRLTSPDSVAALLTLVLVSTFVAALYWSMQPSGQPIPEEIKLALTTILGFWFGRQVRETNVAAPTRL